MVDICFFLPCLSNIIASLPLWLIIAQLFIPITAFFFLFMYAIKRYARLEFPRFFYYIKGFMLGISLGIIYAGQLVKALD